MEGGGVGGGGGGSRGCDENRYIGRDGTRKGEKDRDGGDRGGEGGGGRGGRDNGDGDDGYFALEESGGSSSDEAFWEGRLEEEST